MAVQYVDDITFVADDQSLDDEILDMQQTGMIVNGKVVNTMNKERVAKGVMGGNVQYTGSLTVAPKAVAAVDWEGLMTQRKYFKVIGSPNNGAAKENWIDCRVMKVDHSASDGEGNRKVEILFLKKV
jgi:hypothetical protein